MDTNPNANRSGTHRAPTPLQSLLRKLVGASICLALPTLSGCLKRDDALRYPFHDAEVHYYKDVAQEIAYPAVVAETPEEIAFSLAPHTVLSRDRTELWDMTLAEAVQLALQNNDVVRSAGQFLSPGNSLFTNPSNTPSIYDPAIDESGVLFGGRGIEAALAAFDANFSTSMVWGRDEQVQNNPFFAGGLMPGNTLTRETGNFDASLRKDFAFGGQIRLNQTVNYLGNDIPNQLFPSTYTGLVQALYRQPLWAGAGTEYTSIAGPITQSFGGLSGVTQGVVIARINNDISIADFEANIRNLVKDVQDTYWDLYLAYRNFDTAVTARNSSLKLWGDNKIRLDVGGAVGFEVMSESQARDQFFAAEAAAENTRSAIYTTETRLRRLLALPVNDGRVIRPADEPITAEFTPDWQVSLTEALMNRVELRSQKWRIKSLDLQLLAAQSLTKPRLDFVGGYQVNAFGDDLLDYRDNDVAGTAQGLNNYFETLTQGNQTGWTLGFEFNMPFGFRQAHAQIRNIELRLAKAQQVLYAQELEISQELAVAFQELARAYSTAQAQYNRREAAKSNADQYRLRRDSGTGDILEMDNALRSVERYAQAEVAFFTSMVDYNKALTNFQFRKGTLLEDTNVTLLEGGWNRDAYVDAYRRAQARSAAIDASLKFSAPEKFVSPTPMGEVYFAQPLPPTIPAESREEPLPPPVEQTDQPAPEGDASPSQEVRPQQVPAPPLPGEAQPLAAPPTVSSLLKPDAADQQQSPTAHKSRIMLMSLAPVRPRQTDAQRIADNHEEGRLRDSPADATQAMWWRDDSEADNSAEVESASDNQVDAFPGGQWRSVE